MWVGAAREDVGCNEGLGCNRMGAGGVTGGLGVQIGLWGGWG